MAGVLGRSGKGRKIREGKGLNCGVTLRRLCLQSCWLPCLPCREQLDLPPSFYLQLLPPTSLVRCLLSSIPLVPGGWKVRGTFASVSLVGLAVSGLSKASISRRNFKSRLKSISGSLSPAMKICFWLEAPFIPRFCHCLSREEIYDWPRMNPLYPAF